MICWCVCANMRKYWWVRRWDECRCEGGVGAGAGRSGCRCEGVTLADYVGSLSDCAGVGGAVRPCHSDLAAPVLSASTCVVPSSVPSFPFRISLSATSTGLQQDQGYTARTRLAQSTHTHTHTHTPHMYIPHT